MLIYIYIRGWGGSSWKKKYSKTSDRRYIEKLKGGV
jgi:hypothetical protein